MSAIESLIENVQKLKTHLSDGQFSVCRSDHEKINWGEAFMLGDLFEVIDKALEQAPAELAELKEAKRQLDDAKQFFRPLLEDQ